MHWCGPGLGLHILSILPWAMIPILTILTSVGRTRPSHHQRADGDLRQGSGVSGLARQRTCRWNAAERNRHHQGRQVPHGIHLLEHTQRARRWSSKHWARRNWSNPRRADMLGDCNLAPGMQPTPSAKRPILPQARHPERSRARRGGEAGLQAQALRGSLRGTSATNSRECRRPPDRL